MKICHNCVETIGQFVVQRRYTWRRFWQDYYEMEAEEQWREFEDLSTEFWILIHEFFDEEDALDWRESWRYFRQEFANLRTEYFYDTESWD